MYPLKIARLVPNGLTTYTQRQTELCVLEIQASLQPLPAGNHLSEPAQFVFLGRSVCP